jgi:plastocyanin
MKRMKLYKRKVGIVLVIVVLIVGGAYYYQSNKSVARTDTGKPQSSQRIVDPLKQTQTPAPLTKRQKEQLSTQTATNTQEKTIDVIVGNFYFTPNKITVNQGDKITIVFVNKFGLHNFVIDAFHLRTPPIQVGQFITATFTAEKKGTYAFYSSTGEDRKMGMKGTIIVQ